MSFLRTDLVYTFSNSITVNLYFLHNWIISKVYRKYSKILQVMNKTLRLPTARIRNLILYCSKISLGCLDFPHTSNIYKFFSLRFGEWLSEINKGHIEAFVKKKSSFFCYIQRQLKQEIYKWRWSKLLICRGLCANPAKFAPDRSLFVIYFLLSRHVKDLKRRPLTFRNRQ